MAKSELVLSEEMDKRSHPLLVGSCFFEMCFLQSLDFILSEGLFLLGCHIIKIMRTCIVNSKNNIRIIRIM